MRSLDIIDDRCLCEFSITPSAFGIPHSAFSQLPAWLLPLRYLLRVFFALSSLGSEQDIEKKRSGGEERAKKPLYV